MARKYKTSALSTEGLAVTQKKKSKSKGIFKAVAVAALGAAGLSAFGGFGGGTGTTFMQGLSKGVGKAKTSLGNFFGIGSNLSPNASVTFDGASGKYLSDSQIMSSTNAVSGTKKGSFLGGTGLSGIFDSITNMSSGTAFTIGSILEAIGAATDTSAEDSLASKIAMHEDMMDYRYAALEAEAGAAEADLQMKNRVAAQSGTFMGHSNPITSGADGVPSTGPGFMPKRPTGGLLS